MAGRHNHVSLPNLPHMALEEIARHCPKLSLCSLRLTCKALRHTITPSSILISYMRVKHCLQSLDISHKLAEAWSSATHLEVIGEDFHGQQATTATAQDMKQLPTFFNDTVAALVHWKQLQTASVPVYSPLLLTFMGIGCRLTSLELSDHTFSDKDINFSWPVVRRQVLTCLQLLKDCACLRRLKLHLGYVKLERMHVQLLGHLTQLEQLDFKLKNNADEDEDEDEDDEHDGQVEQPSTDLSAADVVQAVCQLKQLLGLNLSWTDGSQFDSQIQFGSLTCLRTVTVTLVDEDNYCLDAAAFNGCTALEHITLHNGWDETPTCLTQLHRLVHLEMMNAMLSDDRVELLQSCPSLRVLKVGFVELTSELTGMLPALQELHIRGIIQCEAPLRLWAAKLQTLTCGDWYDDTIHDECILLQGHVCLTSLAFVPMPRLLDGDDNAFAAALATLSALRALSVNGIGTTAKSNPARVVSAHSRPCLVPVLLPWAARLQYITIDVHQADASHEQALLLLKAVPSLLTLCVRHDRTQHFRNHRKESPYQGFAKLLWVVSACVCRMHSLKELHIDVHLLGLDESNSDGVPPLTMFLVSLACAPRLSLVRLLHPQDGFKNMKEGSKELGMFKLVQQQVEMAHKLEAGGTLRYHIELL